MATPAPATAPTPRAVQNALFVATHPNPSTPVQIRMFAWATLKSHRGQTINQTRLRQIGGAA